MEKNSGIFPKSKSKYQAHPAKYLAIPAKYQAILTKYQAIPAKFQAIQFEFLEYWPNFRHSDQISDDCNQIPANPTQISCNMDEDWFKYAKYPAMDEDLFKYCKYYCFRAKSESKIFMCLKFCGFQNLLRF